MTDTVSVADRGAGRRLPASAEIRNTAGPTCQIHSFYTALNKASAQGLLKRCVTDPEVCPLQ